MSSIFSEARTLFEFQAVAPAEQTRLPFRSKLSEALEIDGWAERTPHATAIAAPGRKALSYLQLWKEICRLREELLRFVERDEVVAIVIPNCPEAVMLGLAVADVAACSVLDPSLTESEFQTYLSRLQARTLVVLETSSSAAIDVARSLGMQVLRIRPDEAQPAGVFSLLPPDRTARGDFGRRSDAAFLIFTSATTGAPKIVAKDADQLRVSAFCNTGAMGLGHEDRQLLMLPLYHAHGFNSVLGPLLAGAATFVTRSFDAGAFPSWISTFKPTWYSGGAPLHHSVLAIASANPDLFRQCPLRLIRSTGPIADTLLLERLEETLGAPVVNGYGTTESGGITRNCGEDRRAGSVGRAITLELAIMDEIGHLLPPGREGEVVVRGRSVMTAYVDDPEATRAAFRNGWHCTGDIGRLDEDGFLFLVGRKKEFINRGGQKIVPLEVDQALARHPSVADVACFAIEHRTLGEEVAAAVVLRNGDRPGEDALRRIAAETLAPYKVPRKILFVPEIPRTATGKAKRAELTQRYGESCAQQPQDATDTEADSEMEQRLIEIWEPVLGVRGIRRQDDFCALGGDSLSATVMLNEVQQKLGFGRELLDRVDFFETPTVAGLARILQEERESPASAESTPLRIPPAEAQILTFQRGGSKVPVFCFPAKINGLPYYARHLSKSLGEDQPFYMVIPPYPVEDNHLLTIKDLARRSVSALQESVPHGPYVIAGHCYGGVIAWEAASQLVASGEQVSALLLFDTPAPGFPKVFGNWKRYLHSLSALADPGEVVRHLFWLGRLAIRNHGGFFARVLAKAGTRLEAERQRLRGMTMGEYKPKGIPVPVIQFIAKDHEVTTRVLDDPRLGWAKWASAGFSPHYLAGDHFSIFSAENAAELADCVRTALPVEKRAMAASAR